MLKNNYILLLLICISIINSSKISSKNLRNLEAITLTLTEASNLVNENNKLKFDITLGGTPSLVSSTDYYLTVLDRNGKNKAKCTFTSPKLNCQIDCNEPYYGKIKIPKKNIKLDDETITFNLDNEVTLQQTVQLTYKKAYSLFNSNKSTYKLQIYIEEAPLNNAFYQADVKYNNQNKETNCTYSTQDGFLTCDNISGNYQGNVKLSKEKEDGSIQWKNDANYDFDKTVLLKYTVSEIWGYDLDFDSGGHKWNFKVGYSKATVAKAGNYFTINTLLNKASDSSEIKTIALCKQIASSNGVANVAECAIDSIIDPKTGEQDSTDLVYISKDQTGATLNETTGFYKKKDISKIITLTFVKVYELKYEDRIWKFKIDIDNEGLRNGLNVSVDLFSGNTEQTGSCIVNNKILSCVKDHCTSAIEQVYFSMKKKSGSVTWSNVDSSNTKYKIPLTMVLKHLTSYYLKYENEKWIFKLGVENTTLLIPKDSLIKVDVLYGDNQNAIADCQSNNATSTGYYSATFTCECVLASTFENLKINNNKVMGSITWVGLGSPASIDKRLEFKFIRAYNLEYTSLGKWFFEIEFENTEGLNLESTNKYSLDIGFTQPTAHSTYYKALAQCSLKQDFTNIFSCYTTQWNSDEPKDYRLYTISTYHINPTTIVWKDGITDNVQIPSKPKLTFKKGTLKYETTTWIINLDIEATELAVDSKVFVDVYESLSERTLECTVSSNILLKCDTKVTANTPGALSAYTLKKSTVGSSGLTWENTETDDDFYIFYLETTLDFKDVGQLVFEDNKWQFNLKTSSIPPNTKIKIDILYGDAPSTATCIKESTLPLCVVDNASQSQGTSVKLLGDKSESSTISWNGLTGEKEIGTNIIQTTIELTFDKVYDLSPKGNVWIFKIHLTDSNLEDYDTVKIDMKLNGVEKQAECKYAATLKVLTCEIAKVNTNSGDKIIIINKAENDEIEWANLNSPIELYVSYDINFINYYGGFYENKWQFNLKYERSTGNTAEANNNYALLDILVNDVAKTALCKITEKFLLCESQHSPQANTDVITVQQGTKNLGTVSISNLISDDKKVLKPIDITLESPKIPNYSFSTNSIVFKIEGNLKYKDEIAENTITEIQIVVTKKVLTALCLTNEINDNPVILTCKASENVNEEEDDVDIKVDLDGKSKYVTFDSIKDNIEVFRHKVKEETNPSQNNDDTKQTNPGKNYDSMLKINNLLLLSLFILF